MMRELLNSALKEVLKEGLAIHIIKNDAVSYASEEIVEVRNVTLLVVTSGMLEIQCEQIREVLTAKHLMIIPHDSNFKISLKGNKMRFILITFSSQFAFSHGLTKTAVDAFYFCIARFPAALVLQEQEYSVLRLIAKLIVFTRSRRQQNADYQELDRICFSLLLYKLQLIFSAHNTEVPIRYSRNESLVMQFLTTVATNARKEHHAQFYADALFVTPAYLNKIVKLIVGKTVKVLIMEAIIIEAKYLLEETYLSIAEISYELNFGSINSFSAVFKTHTSFSPTQYRNNYQKKRDSNFKNKE
jgi:AraC family transcriptional activator of pobA